MSRYLLAAALGFALLAWWLRRRPAPQRWHLMSGRDYNGTATLRPDPYLQSVVWGRW